MNIKKEGSLRGKVFITDTNIPLHDSSFVFKFEEHSIVIPIYSIEELDKFKKGLDTINFHAREFIRFLDEISQDTIFNGGVSLGEGLGKIRIQLALEMDSEVKKNLKEDSIDNQIINTAYVLKHSPEYSDKEVILLSKDSNVRIKARALGITAQDYMHDIVPNIDILFEEIMQLEVSDTLINTLYKSKSPIIYKNSELSQNQSLILKSHRQKSALAIYKDGFLHKISKDEISAFSIKPKNGEQAFAMNLLLDPSISLVSIEGKAGTGKTILSLACALEQLNKGKYDQIYYSRQTISVGDREIGFLPGDISEKLMPFMMAMEDNLNIISEIKSSNKDKIKEYKFSKTLNIAPFAFLRGRSLPKAIFIVDETQNLTPHEVKTVVTRAGEGSKIILLGDTHQIDNPYLDQKSNGLTYLIDRMKGQSCYAHTRLTKGERSPLAELASQLL